MTICDNCPTPDNCENCTFIETAEISDSQSVTVESVEVADPKSFEADTHEFVEAPAVIRLINTLGSSAQSIHALANELHPGDAGICVALAAQIGAVADMFVSAVEAVQQQADQDEVSE